jgi:hypothetical protein
MLNDPALFEIALGLSARILEERPAPATDLDRLEYAFVLCLGRPASVRELKMLATVLERERADFASSANELAAPRKHSAKDDRKPVLSAWVTIARVLLNLDEFVTRE